MERLLVDDALVIVDKREPQLLVDSIEENGVVVKRELLAIGDIVLPGNIAIERKTTQDFESSIFDGRLFRQLAEIKNHYGRTLLLVEGKEFPERLSKHAREGAIMRIMLMGIPILFTRGIGESGEKIAKLAIKAWKDEEKMYSLLRGRKPKSVEEQLLFVVSSLPNISEKRAKALLSHFGTLRELFSATPKRLLEVEGIGKKTAEELHKLFTFKYGGE